MDVVKDELASRPWTAPSSGRRWALQAALAWGLALAAGTVALVVFDSSSRDAIHKIRKSHRAVRIVDTRGRIYTPPRKAARDGELSGVPISPGVVQGRVRVSVCQ